MNNKKLKKIHCMYKGTALIVNAKPGLYEGYAVEITLDMAEAFYQESKKILKKNYKECFNDLDSIKGKIDCGFFNITVHEQLSYFLLLYSLIKSGKLKKDKQNYCQLSY